MLGDTVVKGKQREKSGISEKQKRSKNASSLPGGTRTEALWLTPSRERELAHHQKRRQQT